MPLHVNPTDLKAAARLTGQIKEMSDAAEKKYRWSTVHRLVASGGTLRLLTTDGTIFLEYAIPVQGKVEEDFDVQISAPQFNSLATCSAEGGLYEIRRSQGMLSLVQGRRVLRLEELLLGTPPAPPAPDGPPTNWTTKASTLANSLEFVTSFMKSNDKPERSVVTWRLDGSLIGGEKTKFAAVTGLGAPRVPLSLKQKTAKAVVAFLRHVPGDVEIQVSGSLDTFTCPSSGHSLVFLGVGLMFPDLLGTLGSGPFETFTIDLKTIQSGVAALGAVLPTGADRLDFRFRGRDVNAAAHLSTLGDEDRRSSDEFPVIRECIDPPADQGEQPRPPDTGFSLSYKSLKGALDQMSSVTLDVKYIGPRKKLLWIREDRDETLPARSVILTVQVLTEPDRDQAVEPTPVQVLAEPDRDQAVEPTTTLDHISPTGTDQDGPTPPPEDDTAAAPKPGSNGVRRAVPRR